MEWFLLTIGGMMIGYFGASFEKKAYYRYVIILAVAGAYLGKIFLFDIFKLDFAAPYSWFSFYSICWGIIGSVMTTVLFLSRRKIARISLVNLNYALLKTRPAYVKIKKRNSR